MQSMQLMKEVKEFSEKYGLSSKTRAKRLKGARSNLRRVTGKVEALQNEIDEKKAKISEINELLSKREALVAQSEELTQVESDVQRNIRDEDALIRQLHRENLSLQVEPDSGEEFSKVNEDLRQYTTDNLESRAEELHAQLSDITEKLRRQEGQTLRLQYRRWQRQRQFQQVESQQQQQQQGSKLSSDGDVHNDSLLNKKADDQTTLAKHHTDRPGFGNFVGVQDATFQLCGTDGIDTSCSMGIQRMLKNVATGRQPTVQVNQGSLDKECIFIDIQEGKRENAHAENYGGSFCESRSDAEEINMCIEQEGKGDLSVNLSHQGGDVNDDDEREQDGFNIIFSQDDILCPSASTVSETTTRSNKESLEETSQNTIFISSPNCLDQN
ncbi:hypothetical protein EGW08_000653 [Elysia chlorotica]|uniref:Uncharacterized protein n=1 Tax=Elysia chlorotica TaxID=188477 RepID=A0A433UCL6_ELYCH|nr:hypothetical protein EGW08_000653 [Elysia chlorotica]